MSEPVQAQQVVGREPELICPPGSDPVQPELQISDCISAPVQVGATPIGKRQLSARLLVVICILTFMAAGIFSARDTTPIRTICAAIDPSLDHMEKYRRYWSASCWVASSRQRELAPLAEYLAELAIEETEKGVGPDNAWKWTIILCCADDEVRRFSPPNLDQAEKYYRRNLLDAERRYGKQSALYAASLGAVAGVQMKMGKKEQALVNLRDSVHYHFLADAFYSPLSIDVALRWIDELTGGPKFEVPEGYQFWPPAEIEAQLSRASILGRVDKGRASNEQADAIYGALLETVQNPLLDYHTDRRLVKVVKSTYAGFLSRHGRPSEAWKITQELNSLEGTKIKDRQCPRWCFPVEIGNELGTAEYAYRNCGDSRKAEEIYKRILSLVQDPNNFYAQEKQVEASVMNSYAGFLRHEGRDEEASVYEKKVVDIRALLCPELARIREHEKR